MKNRLRFIYISILIAAVCLCALSFVYLNKRKNITLEFGMFSDSNWDVPGADNYRIIDKAIAKFEKKHPGVRVHYYSGIRKCDYEEWLSEQILKGKMPDVTVIPNSRFNKFASMGLLKNLDTFIQTGDNIKKSDYFTTAWNSGIYKDNLYALPYEINFMLMAVNKTLLERYGCSLPAKDWTWDIFYKLCKQMTIDKTGDSIPDIVGTCQYTWQEAVYSNNAKLFDDNGTQCFFSNQNVINSVRFMQNLNALTPDQIFTQNDFDAGKVAFMPLSFAKYRTYTSYPYKVTKNPDYEWRYLTMPAGPAGNNVSEIDTLLMGISAHTKYEKEAFDLLEIFTHDKDIQTNIYRYSYGASARRHIAVSDEAMRILAENMDKNDKQYNSSLLSDIMNYSIIAPKFKGYGETMVFADNVIRKIITEKKDADINLKSLQRTIQTKLEK